MKKTLITACLSLFAFGVMAQETAKPVGGSGPMIQVDKDVHDYGTISQGGNGECTFTVTNIGDAPLIITNCKGSCGCTVPKCDTEPVKPGGRTLVTVRYDTTRIGAINKSVNISSNATNEPEKTVRIKGTVIAGVGSTPSPAGTTPQ